MAKICPQKMWALFRCVDGGGILQIVCSQVARSTIGVAHMKRVLDSKLVPRGEGTGRHRSLVGLGGLGGHVGTDEGCDVGGWVPSPVITSARQHQGLELDVDTVAVGGVRCRAAGLRSVAHTRHGAAFLLLTSLTLNQGFNGLDIKHGFPSSEAIFNAPLRIDTYLKRRCVSLYVFHLYPPSA